MIRFKRLFPRPTPSRYPVLKPHKILRSDRCINCGTCIEACIYDCHRRTGDSPRIMADPEENCCRNCFACIRCCPRNALSVQLNDAYTAQGDGTYTPAGIRSILEQAEQGKIPVSGAGYGGPFDGEDYDNIWTDMSEIVRPTRDGIHGREHISTTVALGRAVGDLCGMVFDEQDNLKSHIPPRREIPIPVMFGSRPSFVEPAVLSSLALAANKLNTYLTLEPEQAGEALEEHYSHLMIRLSPSDLERYRHIISWATIIEFTENGDGLSGIARVREINPNVLTVIRVPVSGEAEERIGELARRGAETIHLAADIHGRGGDGSSLLDVLHRSHTKLVLEGLRDRITLLASGGIAAAEHVPKTIIMGADAVSVDIPLLVAMDCLQWPAADQGMRPPAPRNLDDLDSRWGASRVINLMLSWRDQLLEILGAMGLRDVRRLRGETGRAVFADQARRKFLEGLTRAAGPEPEGSGDTCAETPAEVTAGTGARALASESPAGKREPLEWIKAVEVPCRFSVKPGKWRIKVDRLKCTDCGLCAVSCRYGVHRRREGRLYLDEPLHSRCIGESCPANDWCCVHVCPWDALTISKDPMSDVLGDCRWTSALLLETYRMAESGSVSRLAAEAQVGASGGGFDRLLLGAGREGRSVSGPVDLSLELNRRKEGPKRRLSLPIYGGGMSYGSISLSVMLGRAMAAERIGTLISTGEGGYPDALLPHSEHVITQVATGLFGVREETILRSPMIEFKYAQGAKPGLGGHLLGEKNTLEVADMREAVPGTNLFSPFPFHSVYSVEDHKKHLDWIRAIHPDVLISVKVSTPADVDMVAVGSYYAGANVIHLDGAYGGTGAAPDIAKKNIAQPIEYAAAQTHEFLVKEGIRDEVVLVVSGGIRTGEDILKAIALGADGVVVGTAELVALDCVRCGNCERDRGCPIGIATTDPRLAPQMTAEWVCGRICNLYKSWAVYMDKRLRELGMNSIGQLRGRWDLLSPMAGDGKRT
jgi:glutamate synthase domain-containing protein 2/ferredoxin